MHEADLAKKIKALDQVILASSGADSFEEVLKLLISKLFDETQSKNRFKTHSSQTTTHKHIQTLFQTAQKKWPHMYIDKHVLIELSPNIVSEAVKIIEDINISKLDVEIVDNAIEYLLPKTMKGERGQFLTPRYVIDEVIHMINPRENETFYDPACGVGGFLWHAAKHANNTHKKNSIEKKHQYIQKHIRGNDFDTRLTKIASLIILLSGGKDNQVTTSNFLDARTQQYDVIATNPPFAGKITDQNKLKKYTLAKNSRGQQQKSAARHILFLEKIINSAAPGGRIAVILPQGVLNNANMKRVHEYIFEKTRLCAVVTLDKNTFMPHTNIKTSILIMKKWKQKERRSKDYKVFMAISEKSGKNSKGELATKNKKIDHDLKEISKEFEIFKKENKLNF